MRLLHGCDARRLDPLRRRGAVGHRLDRGVRRVPGRYHALGGKLSPAHHTGPEKLRFAELRDRVVREGIAEVLLAVSTDMDGDATAGYAAEVLKGTGAKVTRLAFGLPADSGIAYSDPLTLKRAIANRIAQ